MGWWFGRILTFELIAEPDAVPIGAILSDASSGDISASEGQSVIGYAAYGSSVRSALQPLIDCFAAELFDDGSSVRPPTVDGAIVVSTDMLGSSADDKLEPRVHREQSPVTGVPAVLRLSYYDAARDYQSGEARASASDQGGREERIELPAVLAADDAKSLVHQILARRWTKRDTVAVRLPPAFLDLEPGDEVELPITPQDWTVEKCTIDAFVVIAELTPQ